VPFLSIVHLQPQRCPECGMPVAEPGARSFIVGTDGSPVLFSEDDPPAEMKVEIPCPNGHDVELFVPNEIAAEETLMTPDEAPIATDAVLDSGTTESGAPLSNF
jgi:hypothetical protein